MSRRPKTLVIHIGDHKTGSTSIQRAFARGEVVLEGREVFYPARFNQNRLKTHCRAYARTDKPRARQRAVDTFESLAARIDASKADFCLISAEAFETVPPEVFHDLVTGFFAPAADRIHIIAYVRPHAARLVSSFAERLKIGVPRIMTGDLDSFHREMLGDGRFVYHPRFAALKRLFADRFTLRPMIRSELKNGSVVDDFTEHAFGGVPFHVAGQRSANESLNMQDLMRLKVLQSHLQENHSAKLRHALGWEFGRIIADLPPPENPGRLRLHRSLAETVHEAYLGDAREMDRTFFGGRKLLEGELASALRGAVETPQSLDPEDYLSASDMRSLGILSRIMAGMFRHEGADWPAFLNDMRLRAVLEKQK